MIALFEPILPDFKEGTVARLIERYIQETRQPGGRQLGESHECTLRVLQRSPMGAKMEASLKPSDFIGYCKALIAAGLKPQTVNQYTTSLSGVLKYAVEVWEMPGNGLEAYKKAKAQLKKQQLIAKSQPRDRRPSPDEQERILADLAVSDAQPNSTIKMVPVVMFSMITARRISETCRVLWTDINHEKKTCLVRDLKNPNGKGYHGEFPLLGDSYDIMMAQPRVSDRVFPYKSESCSKRYIDCKKRLGIEDLRLHDCRREAISRLFEQGYNVPEVSKVSLHRNASILLRTYTSLKPEDLHKGPAARRIG